MALQWESAYRENTWKDKASIVNDKASIVNVNSNTTVLLECFVSIKHLRTLRWLINLQQ